MAICRRWPSACRPNRWSLPPYTAIGNYGGTLMGTSRATESGTSDLLSVRHVNLVRYSDDLQTLVPNVAREWAWNDSFTELTFHLRADHKWSDGTPFTAEDIVFWYEDLILNTNVYTETPGRWLFAGEPAQVEAVDATTVKFTFPVPVPGLLNRFAVDYGQPFQPKHFLGQFMDKHNPDAAARRAELGFESEGDAVNFFYGPSDWKDIPTPLLRDATKLDAIGRAVVPTLESHIVVEDNSEGRRLVANPYFHMVDTAGNQLPYINEISETYVPEREVNMLRMLDGQVHWKQQAVFLDDFPVLKENEANANITVGLAPAPGSMTYYSFNRGHKDPVLRDVFGDPRFSVAMSHAMNRDEINEIVFLGQGRPANALPVEPVTVGFVTEEQVTRNTAYDVERANALLDEMGLEMGADGVRLLPDGRPFVLRLTYASQGGPVQMHELVRDYWGAVGVRVDLREVSSDEYRATANANDADILSWKNDGVSAPAFSQDPRSAFPPFGDFFNPGPGIAWDEWKKTDGASGSRAARRRAAPVGPGRTPDANPAGHAGIGCHRVRDCRNPSGPDDPHRHRGGHSRTLHAFEPVAKRAGPESQDLRLLLDLSVSSAAVVPGQLRPRTLGARAMPRAPVFLSDRGCFHGRFPDPSPSGHGADTVDGVLHGVSHHGIATGRLCRPLRLSQIFRHRRGRHPG